VTSQRSLELPIFPLHSVLFPGVALPLHIFEDRYRAMVARCLERGEPFGVVLIRDGREVGGGALSIAEVGTTAIIRQAGRYPDGRMDIVTVGGRRFRVGELDRSREPYLVADVTILEEPVGERNEARKLGTQVGRRFLQYLDLLAPALATGGGADLELEVELEVEGSDDLDDEETPTAIQIFNADAADVGESRRPSLDTSLLDNEQRHRLLMAAARRLTSTSDPTVLSYVITGLVQVELSIRQGLLEADDTVSRLTGLDAVLRREIRLLSRHLKPLVLDPSVSTLRRN
jgi:Lon protease-like protein